MPEISTDQLYHEALWRRCRVPDWDKATVDEKAEAFAFFCKHFWHVKTPKGRVLFDLFPAQDKTVRFWLKERLSVALKARQIGFSTLSAAYAFWLTYFFDDRVVILISKTERHSKKLLNHSKYGYKFLPAWLKLRGPHRVANTHQVLSFANESSIESLPSASEPGRGDTAFLALVDEIGFLPNSEDAYAAIEPVADVGGSIILLGTANGEGNLLHKVWMGAQGVGNEYLDYASIFHSWRAVPGRDEAWYATKKRNMREDKLWQEYPSNAEEAFIRSGRTVFDLDAVDENEPQNPRARGYLRQFPGRDIELVDASDGQLRVWEGPEKGKVYAIGADVAEGLEHGDFSCAQVINARTKEVVAIWHGHVEPDVFGEDILNLLGRWYNNALLGVESNNHGLTTLVALKRTNYPVLYYQHSKGQKFEQKSERMGFRTTVTTKPVIIDELDKSLRGTITSYWDEELEDYVEDERDRGEDAMIVNDSETLAELRTYVRNEKGRMMGSPFDDRVMALAIANEMLQYVWEPHYKVVDKPGPGTMGFLVEQLLKVEGTKHVAMGAFNVRKGPSARIGVRR